eukprot:TRINITY_DN30256_c0_g1_i1.p1 TRINITY_DN30256_c0_g1~~TRINITY_DN30256_c0_g1_i1.p1  ORF type:complete len:563 (+),score=75.45 TRINITY_DN30256_c0_g1_i1:85-1773(+)
MGCALDRCVFPVPPRGEEADALRSHPGLVWLTAPDSGCRIPALYIKAQSRQRPSSAPPSELPVLNSQSLAKATNPLLVQPITLPENSAGPPRSPQHGANRGNTLAAPALALQPPTPLQFVTQTPAEGCAFSPMHRLGPSRTSDATSVTETASGRPLLLADGQVSPGNTVRLKGRLSDPPAPLTAVRPAGGRSPLNSPKRVSVGSHLTPPNVALVGLKLPARDAVMRTNSLQSMATIESFDVAAAEMHRLLTLLVLHGNGESLGPSVGWYEELARRSRCDVFAVEYEGYGIAEGVPSEAGCYRCATAALHYLELAGVRLEDVVVFGRSLGSGPAVDLAGRYPGQLGGLILQSPLASLLSTQCICGCCAPHMRGLDRFHNRDKIRGVTCPVFIIHGEADRVVPARNGRELLALVQRPYQPLWVPEAGHNDLVSVLGKRNYYRQLREFLRYVRDPFGAGPPDLTPATACSPAGGSPRALPAAPPVQSMLPGQYDGADALATSTEKGTARGSLGTPTHFPASAPGARPGPEPPPEAQPAEGEAPVADDSFQTAAGDSTVGRGPRQP